jgi:hypothetical protein
MAKRKGNKTFQIAIKRVKLLSFGIDESAELPDADDLIVNMEKDFSFSEKDNTVVLLLNITFLSETTERMLMNGIVQNVFTIKDLKRFVDPGNPAVVKLPENILSMLLSISVSHSRALMAQSAMGTALQDVYIPLVNPDQMAKELFDLDTSAQPGKEKDAAKSRKDFKAKLNP